MIPKRGLGQCFLTDRRVAGRIVDALEPAPGDHVIEVGPGVCALTELLCGRAASVTAVEIDRGLADIIAITMGSHSNFKLILADALNVAPALLGAPGTNDWAFGIAHERATVKFISNMPYGISTQLMTRLFEEFTFVSKAVLTMQREVSDKLVAKPSDEAYCMLTVFANSFCRPERLFFVAPHCFTPQPGVESAVMAFDAYKSPPVPTGDRAMFFKAVRAAFSNRRKTIENNLISAGLAESRRAAEEAVALAGIPAGRRGESLGVTEFAALARALSNT